ncbi:uncharacterized protein LOC103701932 isoform X1 [Phoenix dactylifera]|uniref:Uncharacterized protein LOC103701932 isoform X1 n=1 Tax=Phoenix dactylifera TaxID=42345 RepID=A0A8B7BP47_PHODC|nr:uncharacterized protein LOC103701932 isoform X1 [Phoenix dactylifera]
MGSSLPFQPPWLFPNKLRGRSSFAGRLSAPFLASRVPRQRRSLWLISSTARKLEASWVPANESSEDGFGGWSVRKTETEDKNGVPKFLFFGAGASMAILLATLTYCSFSRKGFKLHFTAPFNIFHEKLMPMGSAKDPHKDIEPTALEVKKVSETKMDDKADMEPNVSKTKNHLSEGKRIIVPVAADAIQNEALSVLKRLKIIENDVHADELCTRREYARWFVKANSMLERNPKYRMVPKILIAGSIFRAFDDVSVDDPDFWCIQSLAEAGIIHSKLSCMNSTSLSDMGSYYGQGKFSFFPERFVSRFDLVNWKTLVEYSFTSEMKEKMLGNRVGLLDLSASSDASPQLFVDLMAGDQSIIRRVFGNIRRLQPLKPATKAQAAVALTSGRMMEALHAELSRLEAENLSRQAEMEEIRSELLHRGEIQSFWEERLNKEQDRGIEVEKEHQAALFDLEKEKVAQDESLDDYLKEKAALDCRQQLLLSLREEVDGVYEKLATERANIMVEQESLEKLYVDLCSKQDAIRDAKSILEAEKEAIQILRSWVEEEALRVRARAKVLEQAAQRWQCNNGFEPPQPISSDSNDSHRLQESNGKGS